MSSLHTNKLKANKHLYILNVIAVVFYTLVFFNLEIGISSDIMFQSQDATTYNDVAKWIRDGTDSYSTAIRPVLYPLVIFIGSTIAGVYGIWLLHVLMWLLTINFAFLSVRKLTASNTYAYIAAFVIMTNLSLLVLTLHALTEVTTTFLLSAVILFVVKNVHQYKEVYFIHGSIFFLVLLTILKPVFSIPLNIMLFLVLPLCYFKKAFTSFKPILTLAIILLPLVIQIGIVKQKYGQAKVSLISDITLTQYLLAQGIEQIQGTSRIESIEKANAMSDDEQRTYLLTHKWQYVKLFATNLKNNVSGNPNFLYTPKGVAHHKMGQFMKWYNRVAVRLHILLLLPTLILFIAFIKKKNYEELIILLMIGGVSIYYMFVTGISFWQGDRLVLPAIAAWAVLYPFMIFKLVQRYKKTSPDKF